MNKIKLKNGNEYEINDGASLSRIEIPVNEGASEGVVVDLNVKGNLDNVQFLIDEEIIGEYTDMKLSAPCSIETNDEGMTVVFGISEKTDIEKRLDA
ncbi:MAG: hypothetical protein SPJ81_01420, partial [Lachnoclostridium sp.]|nr:hypothetical protein [Lachnoclostridium sp.]